MSSLRRSITATAAAVALTVGAAGTAGATSTATANRLSGADRFLTARAIAEATYDSATVAILVSGRSPADALASAYLSGASDAPLLLTEPDQLPAGIIDTLNNLGVQGVTVIGGTAAVSDHVLQQLRDNDFTVDRLAGVDRYETAQKVAELLPPEAIGNFSAGRAAIIATGDGFADALAAGPMSASQVVPILLTESGSLNAHAASALDTLGIEQALIVGGTAAVSKAVSDEIKAMGIDVRRIAGATRQATAHAVAVVETGELNYPVTSVELARGDDFADALAGGTRGGKIFAPILLTQSRDELGSEARDFITARVESIGKVDVLGGTGVISDAVANDAVAAARGG
jgi:lactocepin